LHIVKKTNSLIKTLTISVLGFICNFQEVNLNELTALAAKEMELQGMTDGVLNSGMKKFSIN